MLIKMLVPCGIQKSNNYGNFLKLIIHIKCKPFIRNSFITKNSIYSARD